MALLNRRLLAIRPGPAPDRARRGLAIVEMVFVLPILVLLLLAMGDFSLVFRDYLAATNAARVAVRQATLSVIPCVPSIREQDGEGVAKAMLARAGVEGVTDIRVHPDDVTKDMCAAGLIDAEIQIQRRLTFLAGFLDLLPTDGLSSVSYVARATALNENGN